MKKIILLCVIACVFSMAVFAQESAAESDDTSIGTSLKYIAAAIAVGASCLAGGIAVGRTGAAAIGALSESPDLFGKAMPFVGFAEGICLWGFLVALLILFI